ncbi:hypothetical protein BKA93DRAFT_741554, partial [Sparassis latifolia]
KNVREFALEMLNRQNRKSPFPDPPSRKELEKFEETGIGGPTVDDFRLDLNSEKRKSPWNILAAEIFADEFVSRSWYACIDHEQIQNAFVIHLKSLGRQYQSQMETGPDPEQVKRMKAIGKNRRRSTLYERRLEACYLNKDLEEFIPILKRMGKDAMSGDESDHLGGGRGGQRQYAIVKEEWRNDVLTPWLRTMDLLQLHTKFNEMGSAAPGNWPRVRKPSMRTVNPGCPVAGLPANFYNPQWLATLRRSQIEQLDIQPAMNVNHTLSALRYAVPPSSSIEEV